MSNLKLLFLVCLVSNSIAAQNYFTDYTPHRIILNLTENPESSIAVTWRTIAEVENPELQIAEATVWRKFENDVKIVEPENEIYNIDSLRTSYSYSAIVQELEPMTTYLYRVGSDKEWSEWNQFTTADDSESNFKFLYFGDPQNSIKEHCSRVFRKAYETSPDAAFWLFAGDIATEPVDSLWDEVFYAGSHIFRITPSIFAPGNHDHPSYIENGKKRRYRNVGPTWRTHLTLPENGIKELPETSFFIDYQGVRFVILNSYAELQLQADWLDSLLSENSNKWTIVAFHHPFYSAGSERDDSDTRDAFLEIFDEYSVDLVLTGHDHTYARSKKLKGGNAVSENESGTVYVVSVSGPKAYSVNQRYSEIMEKMGNEVQLFQEIEILGDTLQYKSFTVLGEIYDSFELVKD